MNAAKHNDKGTTYLQSLSYPLSLTSPYPEGFRPVHITQFSSFERGDVSNNFRVEFENHIGTHIDGPGHMTKLGPLTEFCPPTGLFLRSVVVADVKCTDSKLIEPEDMTPFRDKLKDCEILLLRTGFSQFRETDTLRYVSKNPGISAAFARFIAEACPKLVCIGIDTISFAAMEKVEEGIKAHRILFQRAKPVMLIEDMPLAFDLSDVRLVIVMPLFIEGLDSCPCTIVAELARSA